MSTYIDIVNLQMCSETYVMKYMKNIYSATNFHSVYMRIYSEQHVNIDTEHLHTCSEKYVEVEMVYMHVCIHTCVHTQYESFESMYRNI